MEPAELALAIKQLNDWARSAAPAPEPEPRRLLREHFGADPRKLAVVSRPLTTWQRPNVQLALDAFLAGRDFRVVGLVASETASIGLSELARGQPGTGDARVGEPEHVSIALGEGESASYVRSGLWLVADEHEPLAITTGGGRDHFGREHPVLQVMAARRERAREVLERILELIRERNLYRGRVLEPRLGVRGEISLHVRLLQAIERDRIVLPDGVLERIERTAFGISRHAGRLTAGRRHLRRGLLLHGPPGTGKTLTAMYLATAEQGRTVLILTGAGLGALTMAVELATSLAPAIVILEDVDLVAQERSERPSNALLFELLNAMDGLQADDDVLFVLTTNAPQRLEPALASRPGRVDHAVELPLPDAAGRRRLLELYGEGLELDMDGDEELVDDLHGVSPAFIRELLRRAALIAAERSDGPLRVSGRHLREAYYELRSSSDALTRSLLGDGGG